MESNEENQRGEEEKSKKFLVICSVLILVSLVILGGIIWKRKSSSGLGSLSIKSGNAKNAKSTPTPTPYVYKKAEVNGLNGTYYDSATFTGNNVTRTDSTINFDWGEESPIDKKIGKDLFSVRWSGFVLPKYTETYTFYFTSDDGIRIWINDQKVIDHWDDHGLKEDSAQVSLYTGKLSKIKIEFYERYGSATAKLEWSSKSQSREIVPNDLLFATKAGPGLVGQYFNNTFFEGKPVYRTDSQLLFPGQSKLPVEGINSGKFSVKWKGYLVPKFSQQYSLQFKSDGLIRVWIDGQNVIDEPGYYGATAIVDMEMDKFYEIEIEYVHEKGNPTFEFSWVSQSQKKQTVPSNRLFPVYE